MTISRVRVGAGKANNNNNQTPQGEKGTEHGYGNHRQQQRLRRERLGIHRPRPRSHGPRPVRAQRRTGELPRRTSAYAPPEPLATQRDLGYERQLTEKDSEIGQLRAEKYADAAVLAAERRLADKIEKIETSMNAAVLKQAEYNVANTAAVSSIGSQTAQLMKLTGLVINGPTMLASEGAATAFKAAA